MTGTKIYDLLHSLSIYELNRFYKFLLSPYYNEERRLVKLYDYLLPYFKQKKSQDIDREKVWKSVFGKQVFTNLKYARLLSDLVKKLEGFLIVERVKETQSTESNFLLDVYNERKLDKHFPEPYFFAIKKLEQQPFRDSEFFLHQFQLNAQQNIYLENKHLRTREKNLLQTIESLDTFYLIQKLRYCSAILHYKKFLSLEGEIILFREILEYLGMTPYQHQPAVLLYHSVLLTLIEPEQEQHYLDLRKLMQKHRALFSTNTNKEFFAFALNYCIRKINLGQMNYQGEIFSLYKEALNLELLQDKGSMTPWDFKNIVTIGLRNKEFKWTAQFIEEYKNKITKEDRSNAYTFNMARYHFAIKKYDKVLSLLQDVKYDDVFYLLDSKTTLIKTYFELGEYQPLMSLKESFRILLRRKKVISEQNRINYLNFLRFTLKLYRIDVKQKNKLAELKKQIIATNNVADKSWIVEKLSELG